MTVMGVMIYLVLFIFFWIAFGFIVSIRKKVNKIYDFLLFSKLLGKDKEDKEDK